jgi:hypothetical protein
VGGCCPGVWRVLVMCGRLVPELGESLCDDARHRHVDGAPFIISIESETVTGAGPFGGDAVE